MKIPKQSFSGYGKLLKQSWQTLWEKPIVFFPIIYSYIGFALIFLVFYGLGKLAYGDMASLIDASISSIIAFAILGVIIFFLFGVHVLSLNVAVLRRVSTKKKVDFKRAFRDASTLYRRGLRLVLAMIIASLPLVITIGILAGLATLVVQQPLVLIPIALAGIIFLAATFCYGAWFVFIVPLYAFTDLDAWPMLKQAWTLLWNDKGHVWLTYLINFGISMAAGIVLGLIGGLINTPGEDPAIWWSVINFAVNMVLSLWLLLFVFRSFIGRYKQKVH